MSMTLARSGLLAAAFFVLASGSQQSIADEPRAIIRLWPGDPPGHRGDVGPENDTTTETSGLVAGRRVIRLGNVSTPEAHVFLPADDRRTGSAVVICPGGGYHILAWDLEGTEVAEWLNSMGVAAVLLKYRVPSPNDEARWKHPVQDAQRIISVIRSRAGEYGVQPDHIGILGFSAGGDTAVRTALATERYYDRVDAADDVSCRPDLAVVIYPGYLANEDRTALRDDLHVTAESPSMFLVHAFDDPVPAESSLLLAQALRKAGVPSELHLYDAGGHGYGLRPVDDKPVTRWPRPCENWLRRRGWLSTAASAGGGSRQ